jgi:hypothetical protein
MIAKTTDKFPPEQVKEMIGQLSISTARSTDPAIKLALTNSRISVLLGIMKHKCQDWVMPGISTMVREIIVKMLMDDLIVEDHERAIKARIAYLIEFINKENTEAIEAKSKYFPSESLTLLVDYNKVVDCRDRWKVAAKTYMDNKDAWEISNAMIADINDILTQIELDYNLIIMPKNYSYDINDLTMFKKQPEATQ